jgi:uncharacterized DUF497 family protein
MGEPAVIEFDWDRENVRHLKSHRVDPIELEEMVMGQPAYLEYQTASGEERYKVLGATKAGRVLIGIWTPRDGKVRAVTAYAANRAYQELIQGFVNETETFYTGF